MSENNTRLTTLFYALADRLAAQQANPHRVRAYRRAAESVERLNEDIADIAKRGELQTIAGIGRDLSAKIQEFLSTGAIQSLPGSTAALPHEVANWTSLPGLSVPTVSYLYFRLGIRTLADLETLVQSHLLRTLPGFTVSEPDLLNAIQSRRQSDGS